MALTRGKFPGEAKFDFHLKKVKVVPFSRLGRSIYICRITNVCGMVRKYEPFT